MAEKDSKFEQDFMYFQDLGYASPAKPEGWDHASWRDDASPSYHVGLLCVWMDHVDPTQSEFPEYRADGTRKRFSVSVMDWCNQHGPQFGSEVNHVLCETDDWDEVLACVEANPKLRDFDVPGFYVPGFYVQRDIIHV